jgi:thiol:disulfide interchange protein DsbC
MKKIVEKRPDIAFFLKLFAIISPDPQNVKTILCTKSMAMLEDAYEHKAIAKEECPSKELDENTRFAGENGISSAPTLIFSDGTVQSGYSEAAALEKRIDESKKGSLAGEPAVKSEGQPKNTVETKKNAPGRNNPSTKSSKTSP